MKRVISRRSTAKLAVLLAALLSLMPFSAIPVAAQATTGVLTGTVADPQGGAIANAKVVAKNQETGVETTVSSTGVGSYTFPALPPGKYTVTAEAQGFKRAQIT